ncbi:MAG: ABC transporter ATP-binding protein [Bryobacteraceae bacterium]|jgi:ATP-binding cassette subfamily B protein
MNHAKLDDLELEEEIQDDVEEDEDETPDIAHGVGALRPVFAFLRPYYRKRGSVLALLALGVLAETSYNVAFPLSLKYLIDDALLKQNREALVWILIVLGVLAVVISTVAICVEYLNARLAAAILRDIRHSLFDHLQSLSLHFYSRTTAGEVISRFSTDLGEVEGAVRYWLGMGLTPALELIIAVALLFYLNWPLAIAAMLIFPLTLIGPRIFSPRAVAATYRKKQLEADTLNIVQENVLAQPVIKVFGLQAIAKVWLRRRSIPLAASSVQVNFLSAMVERSVATAVLLLHLVILGFGAWLAFHKRITIGTLVTFENVFWELSYNIGYISQFFPEVMQAAGSIRHMNELFAEKPRINDAPDAIALPRLQREIVFDRVSFGYNGTDRHLSKLSFRIPRGSRAAIVGPSGSGKSTILNLILRLYEPVEGSVCVDGYDLRKVTRESLLSQIAIVFQESFLFHTTIRENIRLGRSDATDADVEAAARAAEIHDFIESLPLGYDTNAGERGSLMSGGQRQRIAIARALVRDPAILLLDEATSALDHATEAAILATLRRVAAGRTVITVTHRLSSAVDADIVLVMGGGELVEAGGHEILRRLWNEPWSR